MKSMKYDLIPRSSDSEAPPTIVKIPSLSRAIGILSEVESEFSVTLILSSEITAPPGIIFYGIHRDYPHGNHDCSGYFYRLRRHARHKVAVSKVFVLP